MQKQTYLRKEEAQIREEKSNQLNFINIKNFCSSENNIKKMEMQVTDWEEILVMYISEDPCSEYIMYSYNSQYKEMIQLKMGQYMMILPKKDVRMTKRDE